MKKLLLSTLLLALSVGTMAQTTYTYDFFYDLKEKTNTGADLTTGCTGSYGGAHMPYGNSRVAYTFNKGCELKFDDSTTNLLSSGSYTIELYFKLDTTNSYKKIIDFDNLGADKGFYNRSGKLNMYPKFTSTDTFIKSGVYQYVAITRDATTKQIRFYHNNKSAGSMYDSSNQYVYNANKKLTFFKDDKNTNNEESSGGVGLIRITNQVLDSATIINTYNGLGNTLGIHTAQTLPTQLYPNPTTQYLHITNRAGYSYTISDIMGRVLQQNNINEKDQKINIEQLPNGMYLLQLQHNNSMEYHMIRKE